MRELIVEELAGDAPPDQAAKARGLVESAGNIAAQLVGLGFAPRDVLQACCAVTGVPPAPQGWLRDPKPPPIEGLDGELCRRLGAAPVATQNGKICIAYTDPEIALRSDALGFPKHQAYLALDRDLEKALALLPTHVDDDSMLFDSDAAAADDDDGRTIVNAPMRFDDHDAKGDESEDDDDVLFDDPTRSLANPPSAPKPARARDAGAPPGASIAARAAKPGPLAPQDTLVNAPARAAPLASTMQSPAKTSPAQPSGATTSDLARRETVRTPGPPAKPRSEHAGLRAVDAAGLSPAPTIVTDAPKPAALAGAKDHPAMRAAPPAGTNGARPAAAAGAKSQRDPSPTVLTPKNASADLNKKALAALSADDLMASDEGDVVSSSKGAVDDDAVDELPDEVHDAATIAMPATTGQGTRAVSPARSEAPVKPEPPPKAAKVVKESAESAFASGDEDEQSREVAASQKQRLKRIAQIASIKRYKIDRVLGRGGMATVYHAIDTKTGEACALKLMEPHLADDAVFVERFKREIRACTALNHENIVRVFDYGEEGGTYYMASEFVDGGTVASLLKGVDRSLPVAIVVPVMLGFLDGLEHAHEQGFVHRDLKPANLMLTKSGIVKIGDFGIAKAQTDTTLTKTGALFGTPAYMSPEQAQGQELDTRSDLFGVGIIFYELLAGYNPFAHENPSTTMFAIAKGQVRQLFDANPNVPDAVERVVQKLLEKDLKKRYQSAGHAREDLRMADAILREKYPDAVALTLADPTGHVDELNRAQSLLESGRAQKLLQRSPPEHAEAAFRMYKATLLDAKNYDAVNTLTQLRADYGFRFTRPEDKQIQELEQALEKKPDQPAVLRRLADLSATHRNLVDMAGFMKRYLRFFPNDTHVSMKLERIVGNDPLAPFTILPEKPVDATDAWSAGDDMLDAARIAAQEHDEPSLTPSGGRGATRPAAKAGSPGPPTPSTPQSPTTDPKRAPHKQSSGSVPAAQTAQTAAALAVEQKPLPPAKDSFELVIRMVKMFLEDIVRSFTGDQGIAAMKENLRERFAADSGDLKDVAKAALGKGKEVVAESLLKQEGRKQLFQGGRSFVSKHWRLAAVVVGFLVLMSAAGRACVWACGSGPATLPPPVVQKKIEMPDDGLTAPSKKSSLSLFGKKKPVEAAKPVEAKPESAKPVDAKPAADAASAVSPEEEARLLADKPAAAAPVDAQTELNDKQEALKKKARAATDPKKAIEIYTQAIDVDPYSNASRDALLERARIYQGQNNFDAAQDDLFRLKRRPDYPQVQADVEQMFTDIAKAKKRAEMQNQNQ